MSDDRPTTTNGDRPSSPRSAPSSTRGLAGRMSGMMHRFEAKVGASPRKRARASLYLLRLTVQVVRQWARDRCPQQAASLAFQTVLSVVPLMAVLLAALRATGMIEAESSLVRFLSDRFVPVSREELAETLHSWSEHVTFQSLGLVGLVSTVVLAFVMYVSLERVLNHIWRAERRRSLAQTFAVFYATATIGPVLLGTSLYQAARFGLTEGWSGFALSLATSYIGLLLANYFLPATKVRVAPAAAGAAVTAVLFELAKYGFSFYVGEFALKRYAGIYGAVAVVPLWLVWIYWSWLMLLLGAEVAHAAQNIHLLERRDRRDHLSLENELVQRVNGPMATRLMVAISEAYIGGAKAVSREQLAARFDLSEDVVDRLVRRLEEHDLLLEVESPVAGLIPARPPSEITVADVLAVFRTSDHIADQDTSAVELLLAELDADVEARTRNATLSALVSGDRPGRARPVTPS